MAKYEINGKAYEGYEYKDDIIILTYRIIHRDWIVPKDKLEAFLCDCKVDGCDDITVFDHTGEERMTFEEAESRFEDYFAFTQVVRRNDGKCFVRIFRLEEEELEYWDNEDIDDLDTVNIDILRTSENPPGLLRYHWEKDESAYALAKDYKFMKNGKEYFAQYDELHNMTFILTNGSILRDVVKWHMGEPNIYITPNLV